MSTKRFALFARRHEMNEWLDEACTALGASLIQQDDQRRVEVAPAASALVVRAGLVRAYFAPNAEDLTQVTEKLVPGRMGLVVCDLPTEEGDSLHLAELASRSDWRGVDGLRHDNPECHRLFTSIRRRIAPRVAAGVWGKSKVTGEAERYKDIHVSAGARSWVAAGGKLRQRGVANVEFLLELP